MPIGDFDDEGPAPDTEAEGTRGDRRSDDSAVVLIRELSMIRAAFIQQGQIVANLHGMITQVQIQQASFEERLSTKLDGVLAALKACEGCSRVERIELQIEKLRGR